MTHGNLKDNPEIISFSWPFQTGLSGDPMMAYELLKKIIHIAPLSPVEALNIHFDDL